MQSWRPILAAGGVLVALAIALGAFDAHGLHNRLSPDRLQLYETAVRYHFYNALGILAIGVAARSIDAAALRWVVPLDDSEARLATTAERALLRRLEGGCQVPLGALATVREGTLTLAVSVCALDGSRHLSTRGHAPALPDEAAALGTRIAEELIKRGAGELMAREREARAVEEP